MNTLDEILLSSPSLETLAARFLNGIRVILPYEAAAIAGRENGKTRVLAHFPPELPTTPLSSTPIPSVLEQKGIIYLEDVESRAVSDPKEAQLVQPFRTMRIRSLLIGALRHRGPTLGVLFVGRTRPQGFSPVEQDTFTALTMRLSLAWENLIQASRGLHHHPVPGRPSSSGGT